MNHSVAKYLTILRTLSAVVVFHVGFPAFAADLTYEADIRPILKEHCFQCHGEQRMKEGNLDLRLRRFLVRGGETGAAITPGDASSSLLYQRVADGEMPPDEDKRLPAKHVELIKRWINAEAPTARDEPEDLDDSPYFTEEERNWWAFQPIERPPVPETDAKLQIRSPIDAFVVRAGQDQNSAFQLARDAGRATLIRRLWIGLLGIPPTPEATTAFVHDPHPAAWSRLVDRVLSSPLYGEHWGRHWLDVAGYADSEGYTDEDTVRENAWRYRDYVILSFNQDKPYSRFVTEQLAGDELIAWPQDELKPEFIESLAATGFLRMAPDGTAKNVDQDVARNQVVADTLEIVGTAILGVTVQCARCHDHRYDPIPQRDYYQLRAIFEPAMDWKAWRTPPNRLVSLYTKADRATRDEIEARAKTVDAKRQERVSFYIDKTLEHELLMIGDELQEPLRTAFKTKTAERSDAQKKLLADHINIANITAGSLYLYDRRRDARAKALDGRRAEKLAAHLARLSQLHPADEVKEATIDQFDPDAAAELARYATAAAEVRKYRIRDELQKIADEATAIRQTIPKEHFLRIVDEKPNHIPDTLIFHRGDHKQSREKVAPAGLSVLGGAKLDGVKLDGAKLEAREDKTAALETSGRRLRFARHLTDGKHPLVARVIANRVWASHFGRGIVSTTGDFGFLGARPTHPKLLDWLAAELISSGWSIKHLHRAILHSQVYRQASFTHRELHTADPENRWLSRWPMQRLRSETLRDAILQVTGKLNTKMFGEPVPVMEDGVGQIVLGKENLDGERKPTKPIPLNGEEFRRSIYVQVRRSRPLGLLENFDLPDLSPNCTDRPSSNVAPQSLMLMNSDFILEMSDTLADRLIRAHASDAKAQLKRGWQLAYGVEPSLQQEAHVARFLEQQTTAFAASEQDAAKAHRAALSTYCQALLGSTQFLYVD